MPSHQRSRGVRGCCTRYTTVQVLESNKPSLVKPPRTHLYYPNLVALSEWNDTHPQT